jgi:hypothetical protein
VKSVKLEEEEEDEEATIKPATKPTGIKVPPKVTMSSGKFERLIRILDIS